MEDQLSDEQKQFFDSIGDSNQVEFTIWEGEDPKKGKTRLSRAKYVDWVTNDVSGRTTPRGAAGPGISNYAPGDLWHPHGFTTVSLQGRNEVVVPVSTHPGMHRDSLIYLLLASTPLPASLLGANTWTDVERIRRHVSSGTAVYMTNQQAELGFWREMQLDPTDPLINSIANAWAVFPAEDLFTRKDGGLLRGPTPRTFLDAATQLRSANKLDLKGEWVSQRSYVDLTYAKALHLLRDPLSSYRLTLPMFADGPRPGPTKVVADDRSAFVNVKFRELPTLPKECLYTDCHVDFMPTMGWDPPTCNTSGFGTWTIVGKGTRLFFFLQEDGTKVTKEYLTRRCNLLQKGRELELDHAETPRWISTHGAVDIQSYISAKGEGNRAVVGEWRSILAGEGDLIIFPPGSIVGTYSIDSSVAFGGDYLCYDTLDRSEEARRTWCSTGTAPSYQERKLSHIDRHRAFMVHVLAMLMALVDSEPPIFDEEKTKGLVKRLAKFLIKFNRYMPLEEQESMRCYTLWDAIVYGTEQPAGVWEGLDFSRITKKFNLKLGDLPQYPRRR